jgi:CheY-like chemotaxis protein/sRNA-binding carbon storage regulator CsrA
LGIAVEILRVSGNTVRVGVEAPQDVRVLRGELMDEKVEAELRESERKQRHAFRNRMHTASLALHLLQKQLEAGHSKAADATLAQVLEAFSELDRTARPPLAQPPKPEAERRRALVVEDNANERELLAGYLQLCGYDVDRVEDGLAAMHYLEEHERPDLMLLDMQMPRMDGRETVSEIRRNPAYRGIKLFAVSGMKRAEMQVPLGQTGVDRWFEKPIKPDEFALQLETELAGA